MLLLGTALAGSAPGERRVVLGASALAFLEVCIVAAFATLFSSFSTPFLSALLTLGVFLIGRNSDTLARLPVKTLGQGMHDAGVLLSRITPNLHVYVPPRPLLTGEAIEARLPSYLGMAAIAAAGWSVGLLALASVIFKRRDFL
jgi:ABC-type transport system involved in multi-copper enzyme maturation permease subunit